MKISRELYDEVLVHALSEAPNECCGMIASQDGVAVKVFPAINVAASPLRYELDPREQLKIELEIDDQGWDLGAIYHSHTRSAPFPSETDRNLAFHPDSIYLIVGLAQPDQPDVQAWWIRDRGATPESAEFVVD
ncbi:MAG: M67 family metallopeptidase [Actinomycetes bacterium]